MLYLLVIVSGILFLIFWSVYKKSLATSTDDGISLVMSVISMSVLIVSLSATIIMFGTWNSVKSECDEKIAVLKNSNNEILNSLSEIISYRFGKSVDSVSDEDAVFLLMYKDMRENEVISAKIKSLHENSQRIKELRIQKASLRSYKFWILVQ